MNDLAPVLSRRKRAARGAFTSTEGVVNMTNNIRHRPHLFDTAVLPALTYASEIWTLRKQDQNAASVTQRAVGWVMFGFFIDESVTAIVDPCATTHSVLGGSTAFVSNPRSFVCSDCNIGFRKHVNRQFLANFDQNSSSPANHNGSMHSPPFLLMSRVVPSDGSCSQLLMSS
ncbi:unnamed protein product [Haemonchus placei]|uniref:Uncharacterized protein n=1 Tax=Haemonchus placei TaxID=6290 RepID=A0A0N4WQ06_HAEPC|nr:unnamed protein product [Haemonchus placei]